MAIWVEPGPQQQLLWAWPGPQHRTAPPNDPQNHPLSPPKPYVWAPNMETQVTFRLPGTDRQPRHREIIAFVFVGFEGRSTGPPNANFWALQGTNIRFWGWFGMGSQGMVGFPCAAEHSYLVHLFLF